MSRALQFSTRVRRYAAAELWETSKWMVFVSYGRWSAMDDMLGTREAAIEKAKAIAKEYGGEYVGVAHNE